MSWDSAMSQESKREEKAKVEFVKLPEGITILRVVGDAPHTRWTHWMPASKRSANCPGKDCPICDVVKKEKAAKVTNPRYNTQKRFSILVLNRETKRVEVLDQGRKFFEELADIRTDNMMKLGEMSNYDIKVKRRGSTSEDTSYRIDTDEAYPITDADKALIDAHVSLEEYFKPHPVEALLRVMAGESFDEVMKDFVDSDGEEIAPSETKEEFSVE
jgi:hypothetical protein